MNYNWPGNICELRNAVKRMSTFVEGDEKRLQHIPRFLLLGYSDKLVINDEMTSLEYMLDEVEKKYLIGIFRENDHNFKNPLKFWGFKEIHYMEN